MGKEVNYAARVKRLVTGLGGLPLKVNSAHYNGQPDILNLMPGGFVSWVETKTTGKGLSPIQKIVHQKFNTLKQRVYVVGTEEQYQIYKEYLTQQQNIYKNGF